jgi:hypothetical protein
LLYRKVAKAIDDIINTLKRSSDSFPEVARGMATISTLRKAFPYGANAAVIRLNQLTQEMESSGNVELASLATRNRLRISMPRFRKTSSAPA